MRSPGKEKSLKKKIAIFRVTAAVEILKNPAYASICTMDMHSISHIAELCEQYSLLIVSNWLASKNGFPIYISAMHADNSFNSMPLLSWPSLADRYPLQLHDDLFEIRRIFESMEKLMDTSLPTHVELLGEIYQQTLSAPLAFDADNNPYIDLKCDHRENGEFYTPAWVADLAFEQWHKADAAVLRERLTLNDPLLSPTILDPSCGCGNFLLAAIRFAEKTGLRPERIRKFAETSIHGKDIDGCAVELSKISALISLGKSFQQCKQEERDIAISTLLFGLDKNIRCEDSLLNACATPAASTQHISDGNSPTSYLEASASSGLINHYDLVITNPPYISFGSRDQQTISLEWQQYLKKRFPASSEYKIRLASIFQEIGIELARSTAKGQCIYFVPDAFLTGSYYQKLRELILKKVDLVSLSEFPERTISDATVGRWCLAQYMHRSASHDSIDTDQTVQVRSFMPIDDEKHELTPAKSNRVDESLKFREFEVPLVVLISKDRSRFQLLFSKEDVEIVSHFSQFAWLGESLKGHTGIRSRIGQASIVSTNKSSKQHQRGLKSGSELSAYKIDWQGNWLDISPEKLFAGGFDPEIISGPKILLRQTGDRLVAAADHLGLYHLNNVHSFVPRLPESRKRLIHYYTGLLNSSLFLYYYRLKTREHKRALAQIDIETVEHLPLPPRNNQIELELEQLAGQLSNSSGANDSSVYSKVDQLIFELYGINNRMQNHIVSSLNRNS